jgi:hypothetical protein
LTANSTPAPQQFCRGYPPAGLRSHCQTGPVISELQRSQRFGHARQPRWRCSARFCCFSTGRIPARSRLLIVSVDTLQRLASSRRVISSRLNCVVLITPNTFQGHKASTYLLNELRGTYLGVCAFQFDRRTVHGIMCALRRARSAASHGLFGSSIKRTLDAFVIVLFCSKMRRVYYAATVNLLKEGSVV